MSVFGMAKFSFTGVNATAAPQDVSVPGVLAGDILLTAFDQNGNNAGYLSVFNSIAPSFGRSRET